MKYDINYIILLLLHLIFFINLLNLPTIDSNNNNFKNLSNIAKDDTLKSTTLVSSEDNDLSKYSSKNKVNNSTKNIYITFTNDDKYIEGIVGLYKSLLVTDSKYNLLVLITDQVSNKSTETLKYLGCEIKLVKMIDIPKNVELEVERWRPAFTKFRAWELIEYDKVIWLDSDLLLLKNIDHLFDFINFKDDPELIYAAVDADANSCQYKPNRLSLINSGIIVLIPNIKIYNLLVSNIAVVASQQKTVNDQDVINITLPNWLPLTYPDYGAQVPHCVCDDKRLWNLEKIYFIHFTAGTKSLPKPWNYNSTNQSPNTCINELYKTWKDIFDKDKNFI